MSALSDSIYAQARIVPVKRENMAVKVTKNPDGSLTVLQSSGNKFTIPAGEKEMQAFVVYTMLNPDCTQ